jgi:hypothetical protein
MSIVHRTYAKNQNDSVIWSGGVRAPTQHPSVLLDPDELHEEDAYAAVFLNVILIICILLAYLIKEYKIYYLPERQVHVI